MARQGIHKALVCCPEATPIWTNEKNNDEVFQNRCADWSFAGYNHYTHSLPFSNALNRFDFSCQLEASHLPVAHTPLLAGKHQVRRKIQTSIVARARAACSFL